MLSAVIFHFMDLASTKGESVAQDCCQEWHILEDWLGKDHLRKVLRWPACVMATSVLVTEVPMLVPMMMGTASRTVRTARGQFSSSSPPTCVFFGKRRGSYSRPEETMLTTMEEEVDELWTSSVTRIPMTNPATGLDRTALSWKMLPAALPGCILKKGGRKIKKPYTEEKLVLGFSFEWWPKCLVRKIALEKCVYLQWAGKQSSGCRESKWTCRGSPAAGSPSPMRPRPLTLYPWCPGLSHIKQTNVLGVFFFNKDCIFGFPCSTM